MALILPLHSPYLVLTWPLDGPYKALHTPYSRDIGFARHLHSPCYIGVVGFSMISTVAGICWHGTHKIVSPCSLQPSMNAYIGCTSQAPLVLT